MGLLDGIKRLFSGSARATELVPAPIFKAALQSAFDALLAPHRFDRVAELKWVRSEKDAIRDVLELYALKGASVAPRWGYSLDFAPHVARGQVRWHRTPKSALLDLLWDPLDFDGTEAWTLSRLVAPEDLPSLARRFADKVGRSALSDLGRAKVVADLPPLYEAWEKRGSVRFSASNYQQAALAKAFVLQRLRLPGALECLRTGAAQFELSAEVLHELERRLESSSAA